MDSLWALFSQPVVNGLSTLVDRIDFAFPVPYLCIVRTMKRAPSPDKLTRKFNPLNFKKYD